MPRRKQSMNQLTSADGPPSSFATSEDGRNTGSSPETSAASDLSRIAELIANGTISFPNGASETELAALHDKVRLLRRERLIRHIARAIALDLRRTGP